MAMIGVGIDLVEIERVALLLRRKGDHAMRRLLTEAERAYVESRGHPERHFAARFAAKEATYKALQSLPGARAIGWRDIEVISGDMGRPVLALHGVARELAEAAGGITLHVSLTHTEQTAGAVVVAEKKGTGNGKQGTGDR